MPDVVIENPVLNSPYEEPGRHFRFDDQGITSDIEEGRRPSSYFVPEHVERAARAAIRGLGYDLLVVCGFAFDAHASEKTREFAPEQIQGDGAGDRFAFAEGVRQYGKLPVMLARINPDLAMGDDLLKKTGAGNLFTVFGEPDVDIERTWDGDILVELRGSMCMTRPPATYALPRRTISPAGSSTATTTSRASSCGTPILRVQTSRTSAFSARSAQRSTRSHGPLSTRPVAARSRSQRAARSPSR